MRIEEAGEAQLTLLTVLNALNSLTQSAATSETAYADFFYAIGDLAANGYGLIVSGPYSGLGPALASCFALATTAGATLQDMEAVRVTALTIQPQYRTGGYLAIYAAQLALAQEALIIAATDYTSSQDAETALTYIANAFDYSINFAADNCDSASYQALITAKSAVVRDLRARAIMLPQIITYSFGRVMTSHALSQRIYGTAARANELVRLNKVIDPQFMPIAGLALSE